MSAISYETNENGLHANFGRDVCKRGACDRSGFGRDAPSSQSPSSQRAPTGAVTCRAQRVLAREVCGEVTLPGLVELQLFCSCQRLRPTGTYRIPGLQLPESGSRQRPRAAPDRPHCESPGADTGTTRRMVLRFGDDQCTRNAGQNLLLCVRFLAAANPPAGPRATSFSA